MNRFSKAAVQSLLLGLAFVLLAVSFHAVFAADHDCAGHDCPVCTQMEKSRECFRCPLQSAAIRTLDAATVFVFRPFRAAIVWRADSTPVSLCIRLSE